MLTVVQSQINSPWSGDLDDRPRGEHMRTLPHWIFTPIKALTDWSYSLLWAFQGRSGLRMSSISVTLTLNHGVAWKSMCCLSNLIIWGAVNEKNSFCLRLDMSRSSYSALTQHRIEFDMCHPKMCKSRPRWRSQRILFGPVRMIRQPSIISERLRSWYPTSQRLWDILNLYIRWLPKKKKTRLSKERGNWILFRNMPSPWAIRRSKRRNSSKCMMDKWRWIMNVLRITRNIASIMLLLPSMADRSVI